MIDPKHQRKGIERKLLQTAVDVSEAQGIPAMLQSSRESHPLYRSFGFQDKKIWATDDEYWAGEIEKLEKELGIPGSEGLMEECVGLSEDEALMMRWPVNKR